MSVRFFYAPGGDAVAPFDVRADMPDDMAVLTGRGSTLA